jgi:hypothetical protein
MSYTMMLRSGLLLFLIGYPFCLNRYIISAIFFVIRCALVTRKKFYFFLSAVGRRIEWVFSWVVYMHIRMESAATGIIFDCVKHERLCVTMDRFFRLRICLISFKYIYLLVEEPWVIYSDTIVYVQCSTYGIYWRFVFLLLRYSFIKGVKEGLYSTGHNVHSRLIRCRLVSPDFLFNLGIHLVGCCRRGFVHCLTFPWRLALSGRAAPYKSALNKKVFRFLDIKKT